MSVSTSDFLGAKLSIVCYRMIGIGRGFLKVQFSKSSLREVTSTDSLCDSSLNDMVALEVVCLPDLGNGWWL